MGKDEEGVGWRWGRTTHKNINETQLFSRDIQIKELVHGTKICLTHEDSLHPAFPSHVFAGCMRGGLGGIATPCAFIWQPNGKGRGRSGGRGGAYYWNTNYFREHPRIKELAPGSIKCLTHEDSLHPAFSPHLFASNSWRKNSIQLDRVLCCF